MPDLVSRISSAIKAQGLTFNKVEHDLGLGNGTIKRWKEQSPRLDKLVLVSEYLNASLDFLVFGNLQTECSPIRDCEDALATLKVEQGLTCDGSPISGEEADLIAMYRLLPEEQQEDIFDVIHLKYRKHVERKKESIYWTYAADREEKSAPSRAGSAQDGTA